MIEISRLHALFSYNKETGVITSRRTGKVLIGEFLSVDGARIKAENCIWAMCNGEWPIEILDHKDRDPTNRRINNLRPATYSQNGYNMASRNSFAKGVTYDATRPSRPWRVQGRIKGKKINLGRYATMEEAAEAYRQAALKYHGEFACLD